MTVSGMTTSAPTKLAMHDRVGDENRGVEHDPSSHTPLDIDVTSMGRDEIGQRNSNRLFGLTSELGNATVVAEGARSMVDIGR